MEYISQVLISYFLCVQVKLSYLPVLGHTRHVKENFFSVTEDTLII